jgi:hypothetical protein
VLDVPVRQDVEIIPNDNIARLNKKEVLHGINSAKLLR